MKHKNSGASWSLVGILLAILVFLGVGLMFSSLRIQELGAEIKVLQKDRQPKKVVGTKKDVDHKYKLKR